MSNWLSDPRWTGIGVIVTVIGIIVSVIIADPSVLSFLKKVAQNCFNKKVIWIILIVIVIGVIVAVNNHSIPPKNNRFILNKDESVSLCNKHFKISFHGIHEPSNNEIKLYINGDKTKWMKIGEFEKFDHNLVNLTIIYRKYNTEENGPLIEFECNEGSSLVFP